MVLSNIKLNIQNENINGIKETNVQTVNKIEKLTNLGHPESSAVFLW